MTTTLAWTGVALWVVFATFAVFGPSPGLAKVPARRARRVRM